MPNDDAVRRGLDALRTAVLEAVLALDPWTPAPVLNSGPGWGRTPAPPPSADLHGLAMAATSSTQRGAPKASEGARSLPSVNRHGDGDLAASTVQDDGEATRLIALVELARNGDKDAFGQLYDHYQPSVYRFLYYRLGSIPLAEDLAAETFFRALRSMDSFRWQGKDFSAWLMTIARNLATDHYKAGRTRLEQPTDDVRALDKSAESPEAEVLASLTNEVLLAALGELPEEQRECLIMRFLQGLSIAETAELLDRSAGAVKQLQLRGVRNLAKLLPEGVHS